MTESSTLGIGRQSNKRHTPPNMKACLNISRTIPVYASLRLLTAHLTGRFAKNPHFSEALTGLRLYTPLCHPLPLLAYAPRSSRRHPQPESRESNLSILKKCP